MLSGKLDVCACIYNVMYVKDQNCWPIQEPSRQFYIQPIFFAHNLVQIYLYVV